MVAAILLEGLPWQVVSVIRVARQSSVGFLCQGVHQLAIPALHCQTESLNERCMCCCAVVCCCSKRNQLGDFYAWNACLSHILNLAKVIGTDMACTVQSSAVCTDSVASMTALTCRFLCMLQHQR